MNEKLKVKMNNFLTIFFLFIFPALLIISLFLLVNCTDLKNVKFGNENVDSKEMKWEKVGGWRYVD